MGCYWPLVAFVYLSLPLEAFPPFLFFFGRSWQLICMLKNKPLTVPIWAQWPFANVFQANLTELILISSIFEMIPLTHGIHLPRVSAPPLFVEDDANICNHTTPPHITPPSNPISATQALSPLLSLFLSVFFSLSFIKTQAASGSRGKLRAASGSELQGQPRGKEIH